MKNSVIYPVLFIFLMLDFFSHSQIFDTLLKTRNERSLTEIQFFEDKKYFISVSHNPLDSLLPSSYSGIYEVNNDTIHLFSMDVSIVDSISVLDYQDSTLHDDNFQILHFTMMYERDNQLFYRLSVMSENFDFIKVNKNTFEFSEIKRNNMEGYIKIFKKEDFNNPVEIESTLMGEETNLFYFIHDFKNTFEIIYYIKAGFDNSTTINLIEKGYLPESLKIKNKVYYLKYYSGK